MSFIYRRFNVICTVSDFLDEAKSSGKTTLTAKISKEEWTDRKYNCVYPYYILSLAYNGNTKKVSKKTDWNNEGHEVVLKKDLAKVLSLAREKGLKINLSTAA